MMQTICTQGLFINQSFSNAHVVIHALAPTTLARSLIAFASVPFHATETPETGLTPQCERKLARLCGAVGLFLVLYALIIHCFRSKD